MRCQQLLPSRIRGSIFLSLVELLPLLFSLPPQLSSAFISLQSVFKNGSCTL